ncbi:hypothetical protein [Novosphingobium sp. FSW06-99]|uniref:hypothetical protein n=1 Tax=Novosphingobium sp. FSW06-99 TaxID=1739113 RepID=UPI00076CA9D9|nr:hypothetical protein [Novosphingobium sp. FSW06-99]KUR80899.1 hypothetical protein AQZ49_02430 [Novosphingobium sp. FSW06-99]
MTKVITSGTLGGDGVAYVETTDVNGSPAKIGAVTLVDQSGTLLGPTGNPLAILDGFQAAVTAAWTTATTVNTALAVNTAGYDTIVVTLNAGATFAGGAAVCEVYDGVNWLPIKGSVVLNYTTTGNTITPTANTIVGYQFGVAGFPQFRVRLGTVLSAGTLGVTIIASSAPDTSLVTVGLDPSQPLPSGTNSVGTVGLNAGGNLIGATVPSAVSSSIGTALSALRIPSGASGVVKASSARFYGYDLINTQTTPRYLQLYNKTTAGVPGTDTPAITIPLTASGSKNTFSDIGVAESLGLSWAITTDAPGATIGASGDVLGTVYYA